ncbi:MAG: ABC transporter permease, partial [Paludibacteraceae bacterium]|nr:ABC transporter permease [Paludibacteraceae bacterium]
AGAGLASTLGFAPYFVDPLYIYAPQRKSAISLSRPETNFVLDHVFISAIFGVQQPEYDNKYVITPIQLARDLFQYNATTVSSVELKIGDKYDKKSIKSKIKKTLGPTYKVLDRYEQQEDFFRIMKVEKWITYLILSFILLIAIFNIIGSLSMLIIDKKADIITLRNLGADLKTIRRIFLVEGWLIAMLGAFIGLLLGVVLCLLQQYYGFISLPGSQFIVSAYPVDLQLMDVVLIFVTVSFMGFLTAYYPAKQIKIDSLSD